MPIILAFDKKAYYQQYFQNVVSSFERKTKNINCLAMSIGLTSLDKCFSTSSVLLPCLLPAGSKNKNNVKCM